MRMRLGRLAFAAMVAAGGSGLATAQPPDRIRIGNFSIDAHEVTIGAFRAFAQARGLKTAAEREGGGFEYAAGWTRRTGWSYAAPQGTAGAANEPAAHVTWSEANDYCRHAGGRLPSFEEWKHAAYTETRDVPTDGFAKGKTYPYPVGDAPDGMNLNRTHHVPVATTARGVNGLYDMGANLWEWVADRRGDDALTAGGSWWYGPPQTRADGAQWKPAGFYAVYVGFRCAYNPGN